MSPEAILHARNQGCVARAVCKPSSALRTFEGPRESHGGDSARPSSRLCRQGDKGPDGSQSRIEHGGTCWGFLGSRAGAVPIVGRLDSPVTKENAPVAKAGR